jgi:dipeptidyl-peptidase-3
LHKLRAISVVCFGLIAAAGAAGAGQNGTSASQAAPSSLAARVRATGFIQLTADSFAGLTPDQKMDAYWLYRAAVAVDPIAYDQNSADGLREKHLLEAILTHPNGIDPGVGKKIAEYTMLFWGNKGNHDTNTSVKILPEFTADELRAAAEQASKNGAALGSATGLARELQ